MLKFVNILLTGCLLWCPYVCLGERTQVGCGDPFCTDSGQSPTPRSGKSANDKCCCGKHDVESPPASMPHKHAPLPRRGPRQCVCEGAPAITDVRPLTFDLTHVSTLDVDRSTHRTGGLNGMHGPGVGNLTPAQLAHCGICVRVCALLL